MYGLLISLGAFAAFFVSEKAAKKRNLELSFFYKLVNVAIITGVIGARLYHVLDYWNVYSQNPLATIQIWNGGLGIYGGLIGGFLGLWATVNLAGKNLAGWLDIFALGMPLAQAIGRWGNFFNQELYGIPTSLPWGFKISGTSFHPLFLYESTLNIILFAVLQILWKKKGRTAKKGFFFWSYALGYGAIRFSLEFLRVNPWQILGVNVAQLISSGLILISLIKLLGLGKPNTTKSKEKPSRVLK